MVLGSGHLELLQRTPGKDIVSDDVVLAVMLMESAALGIVDQIVFHDDVAAALVGIESPTAIAIRLDVVYAVVGYYSPFAGAERVDRTHIAQQTQADMMQMVVDEFIAPGKTLSVAPVPACGYRAVVQVAHIIVAYPVFIAVAHPNANRTWKQVATIMDDAVVDYIGKRLLLLLWTNRGFANTDSSGTQIVQKAGLDAAITAPFPKPNSVIPR